MTSQHAGRGRRGVVIIAVIALIAGLLAWPATGASAVPGTLSPIPAVGPPAITTGPVDDVRTRYTSDTLGTPVGSDDTHAANCTSDAADRSVRYDEAIVGLGADVVPGTDGDASPAQPVGAVVADCRPFVGATPVLDTTVAPTEVDLRGMADDPGGYAPPTEACPTGQVLTGLDADSVFGAGLPGPLADLRPYCATLDAQGRTVNDAQAQQWLSDAGGPGAGVPAGTVSCPVGSFVTNLRGYTGDDVDGIAIVCDAPIFDPPAPQPANSSWTTATSLAATDTTTQALTSNDGALWYRFPVQPDSMVQVGLTGLPADDDLAVFSDISQAYATLNSTQDLTRISAEAAGVTFSPTTFSPTTFSPTTFSPTTFSPTTFSPTTFSPTTFSPTTFSPTTFSPTTFSPTTFSPTTFSPTTFSPYVTPDDYTRAGAFADTSTFEQAYSSAQTRSVLAVSANAGLSPESVTLDSGTHTGDFYVRVTAKNGMGSASPFTLTVASSGGPCATVLDDYSGDPTIAGSPGSVSTVVLTDTSRLADATGVLAQADRTFAAGLPGGAAVVDLAASPRVHALDAQADAHPECPYAEDLAAQAIRAIVNSYRDPSGTLRYVVIQGGDDVVPFFRYADHAGVATESGFVPPVGDTTASHSSLANDLVLSQDAYGSAVDLDLHGATLPVPDLAVGRLVGGAAQVAQTLTNYTSGTTARIQVSSTLSTGYDFLAAASKQIAGTFRAGNPGGTNDTLITDNGVARSSTTVNGTPSPSTSWTAADLDTAFVQRRHDLVYLAGHFSANLAQAADYATALSTHDLAAASPAPSASRFLDSLVISPGCHSGYDIVDRDAVPQVTDTLDWTTELAAQGATLIAGTGYQYGDTDFVKYSNQLYADLATELRTGTGPLPVGAALVQAKIDYLSGQATLDGVDEKSLTESTLYGLPMQTIAMPSQVTPPAAAAPLATTVTGTDPGRTLGLSSADITVTPALTTHPGTLTSTGGGTVAASYLSGPDGVESVPGAPTLPLVTQNATAPAGTVLRGVGFWSGDYTDTDGITPLTGAPATETDTTHGPFVSDVFYPDVLATPNYFGTLTGTAGTSLQVTPAQYRSDGAGSLTDTRRTFSALGYRLFYSGNHRSYAGNTPAIAAPPSMSGITATPSPGGQSITVSAHVIGDPSAGIQDVWVTWTDPRAGGTTKHWDSIALTQDRRDSTLWGGTLTLPNGAVAADVRYLVQAVNGAGVVGADDNTGHYFSVVDPSAAAPDPSTLTITGTVAPSVVAGSGVSVSATLATSGASSVAQQPVILTLGGSSVIATTDASGVASATVPVTAAPGPIALSASFPGSVGLGPSSDGPDPITVTRRTSALQLATSATGGATATLTDTTAHAVGIPSRSVFVVAQDNTGGVLAVFALSTSADGTASVAPSAVPALTAGLRAYFGCASTPSGLGTFDQSDPLYLAATSAPVPFAPNHIALSLPGGTTIASGTPAGVVATAYDGATPADALGPVTGAASFSIAPRTGGSRTGAGCSGATCTATVAGTYTITGSYAVGGVTRDATIVLTVLAGPSASVNAISGAPQAATSGTAFAAPLVARVLDAAGNPVRGVPVTFTVPASSSSAGGASFAGGARSVTVTTTAGGLATSPALTAGSQPGPVTVTASGSDPTAPAATFQLAVTPRGSGAAADLAVSVSTPAGEPGGGSVRVRVRIANAGPSAADRLGAGLLVPNGWSVLSSGGGTLIGRRLVLWAASGLAPNATLSYVAILRATSVTGPASLTASVLSGTADPDHGDNVVTVALRIR